MTDRELERKLSDAVAHTVPDDLDVILSRCGEQNGSVMELNALKENQSVTDMDAVKGKPGKKLSRWLAAACAALVLLGAGGGGLIYQRSYAVASVVSLDVNPSIELKVNQSDKVLSCTALNEEAAAVLFDMDGGADLKGTKVDVAVNAIVGALVRAGYLDSISSAILISVEDNDQARAARLQAELVASVDGVLQAQAPGTSVLSQVLTMDAGTDSAYGISAGKSALVQRIIENNGMDAAAFDQLAALSVEELSDLLKTGETRIPIGKSAASLAAEEYAGIAALNSVAAEVDPELDELPAHYEVKLKYGDKKYEYKVDAFTGEILSGQKDILNPPAVPDTVPETPSTQTPSTQTPSTQTPSTQTPSTQQPAVTTPTAPSASDQDVGQEAAKQAALDHAGLSAGDVTSWKIERDWEKGRLEYEVEFWYGATEYDYTIDGYSCAVLKCEVDHHTSSGSGHHSDSHHSDTTTAAADIGQEAAKQAALNHAGVSESQTSKLKVKQDWDDGRLEYEVEFKAGGMEYEYTIDGATGAVLEYEWDD